jgi:hypothetical protein
MWVVTFRWITLAVVAAALGGCPAGVDRETAADYDGDDSGGGGAGAGSGMSVPAECTRDTDCAAAGPKCCDCPTHAVPTTDPAQQACANVDCAPASCGSPMQAACSDNGQCVLECAPVACEASSCPSGFATDANGCLTCECAGSADLGECMQDSDCSRVREDCCGCAMGGSDTAVPTSEAAAHDAALMCSATPYCTGLDTCAADLAARCVQGSCSLVAGPLPDNACGRADLAACPTGEACYVNASDQATMHGVGICQP